jgi:hypothetical protein
MDESTEAEHHFRGLAFGIRDLIDQIVEIFVRHGPHFDAWSIRIGQSALAERTLTEIQCAMHQIVRLHPRERDCRCLLNGSCASSMHHSQLRWIDPRSGNIQSVKRGSHSV